MPTFSSVTETFITGLDKLAAYLPAMISGLQAGDKKFQQHKDKLVGVPLTFSGLGANAFSLAVERNITRSTQFQFKMHALALATSHTKAQIVSINNKYDAEILMVPGTPSALFEESLNHYGYSGRDVLTRMRDAVLSGLYFGFGQLLDDGPNMCYYWVDNERDVIIADINDKHNRNVQKEKDSHQQSNSKLNINNEIVPEEDYFWEAKYAVSTPLHQQVYDAITGWFHEITLALSSYKEATAMAAAINVVTVGEMIWELNNAPGHAPVVIYRSPNGGLMVLIGNGVTDKQVNAAIQNYIAANHLNDDGKHMVQITLMGYQSGGKTAQDLLSHYAANGHYSIDGHGKYHYDANWNYHVENLVLVGSQLSLKNGPNDVNYESYVSPQDTKAGDKSYGYLPTNAYQWENLALNGVFNVATSGPGMGLFSTAAGQAFNLATNVQQDHNNFSDISFADPNGYFARPGKYTLNDINQPIPYYAGGHVVPFEAGGEHTKNWNGVITPHYDQSSYLDGAPIVDPTGTYQKQLPDAQGGVKNGSAILQGPHPLSPPTHYSLQNGQLVPSS